MIPVSFDHYGMTSTGLMTSNPVSGCSGQAAERMCCLLPVTHASGATWPKY
jgi:hypothetical protein